MRTLKVQMQISIDGFVARPDGANDWISAIGDKEATDLVVQYADTCDLILMGRKMSADFLPFWENVVDNEKNSSQYDLATRMVNMKKVVFSKTMKSTNGRNARVENGDLKTEVIKLKNQPGKDILVYGGASFVANLIKENLVDRFVLFVNPTAIGEGMPIFKDTRKMSLLESKSYSNGIIVNHYKPI